jgi:hypothetical protein
MTQGDVDRLVDMWNADASKFMDELKKFFPFIILINGYGNYAPYDFCLETFGECLWKNSPESKCFLDARWDMFAGNPRFRTAEDAMMFKLGYIDDNL